MQPLCEILKLALSSAFRHININILQLYSILNIVGVYNLFGCNYYREFYVDKPAIYAARTWLQILVQAWTSIQLFRHRWPHQDDIQLYDLLNPYGQIF